MLDWIQFRWEGGGYVGVHCGPTLVDPCQAGVPIIALVWLIGHCGARVNERGAHNGLPRAPPAPESSQAYLGSIVRGSCTPTEWVVLRLFS